MLDLEPPGRRAGATQEGEGRGASACVDEEVRREDCGSCGLGASRLGFVRPCAPSIGRRLGFVRLKRVREVRACGYVGLALQLASVSDAAPSAYWLQLAGVHVEDGDHATTAQKKGCVANGHSQDLGRGSWWRRRVRRRCACRSPGPWPWLPSTATTDAVASCWVVDREKKEKDQCAVGGDECRNKKLKVDPLSDGTKRKKTENKER